MENYVVNGLDKQPISSIAETIKNLGFNCIRLPFSLEQYYDNPTIEVEKIEIVFCLFYCELFSGGQIICKSRAYWQNIS